MYRLYRNKSMCGNKRLQCVRLNFVFVWNKNLYANRSLHRNKKCLGFSVGCTRYVGTWYLRTRVGYVLYVTNDKMNCKKEYYRLSSTCGAPRNHTNGQPEDARLMTVTSISCRLF